MTKLRILLLLILASVCFDSSVYAQQTAGGEHGRKVVDLALHASASTRPTLQYPLLPNIIDQRPGNGALLYQSAAKIGPDPKAADDLTFQLSNRYGDMPISALAKSDFPAAIQPFAERLDVVDLAARREDTRWETTMREQGAGAMLLYLNDLRVNVRILSLKSRWQVARGDWTGASRTFQTAIGMSLQMNDRAVLIQGLVETSMVDAILDRVTDWISQRGSPNLYWSLSDLPANFVDLRSISQWEQAMIYFTFPQLAASQPEQISAEDWKNIFASVNRMASSRGAKPITPQQLSLLISSTYPKAKASLIARGIPQDKAEAMSVNQVVGSYFFREYLAASEDAWKSWELPYWEGLGRDGLTPGAWEQHRQQVAENPLLAFVPLVKNARLQFARIDRKICFLRILEAIRDYAATHNMFLPASLDELKSLPAPLDPITGKPFPYRSDGASAALELTPDTPGYPSSGTTYRLTVAR